MERLVTSLERSGSDFVVGSFVRIDADAQWEPRWTRKFHEREMIGITIDEMPGILQNVFAWGKVYRTTSTGESFTRFPKESATRIRNLPPAPTLRPQRSTSSRTGFYEWHTRAASITQQKWRLEDLRDRFEVWHRVMHFLKQSAPEPVVNSWAASGPFRGPSPVLRARSSDRK